MLAAPKEKIYLVLTYIARSERVSKPLLIPSCRDVVPYQPQLIRRLKERCQNKGNIFNAPPEKVLSMPAHTILVNCGFSPLRKGLETGRGILESD
jgi:hypothetical protein